MMIFPPTHPLVVVDDRAPRDLVALSDAFVDELAAAADGLARARLALRVVQELDDVVRWVVGGTSLPELASLQLLVAASDRHLQRSVSWACADSRGAVR